MLIDLSNFKIIRTLDHACRLAAISDDARLAVTEVNNIIWLWDLQTGELLFTDKFSKSAPSVIALSGNAQRAIYVRNGIDVCVLDTNTLQTTFLKGHIQQIRGLHIDHSGNRAVSVCGGQGDEYKENVLRLWDLQAGRCLWTSPALVDGLADVALTRDGQSVVTLECDKGIKWWNLDSYADWQSGQVCALPKLISVPRSGHQALDLLNSAEHARKEAGQCESAGQWKQAYEWLRAAQRESQDLWQKEDRDMLWRLAKHGRRVRLRDFIQRNKVVLDSPISGAIMLADPEQVFIGDERGHLHIYDLKVGSKLRTSKLTENIGKVTRIAGLPGSSLAVVIGMEKGVEDYTLALWDVPRWNPRQMFKMRSLYDVSISPDDRYAILVQSSGGHLLDLKSGDTIGSLRGKKLWIIGHQMVCASFFPDGQQALTGAEDGKLSIWDLDSMVKLAVLNHHQRKVNCVAVSPNGCMGLSGGLETKVVVWDLPQRRVRYEFPVGASVSGVLFSSDGKLALSYGKDTAIHIWDLDRGDTVCTLQGHKDSVSGLQLSPDGRYLLSCGLDGALCLWELDWEFDFPASSGLSEEIQIYLEQFIHLHRAVVPGSLRRTGLPRWTLQEQSVFLSCLADRGFGWMDRSEITQRLSQLASSEDFYSNE